MSVLFIGGVFACENEEEIIENTKGYVEFSANIFQKKLIKGFKQNKEVITILSAPFIGSYPNRYKKIFFKGFESEQFEYRYVNFCNIWGYRNFSRAKSLKNEIKNIILKENKSFDLILVYSAHEPFLEAAVYAKKLLPETKICFVVPDLPQYMNLDKNKTIIYDIFKKIDIKKMQYLMMKVDSFVVLTEQMKEVLNIGNRPYMVVEGIIEELQDSIIVRQEVKVKSIVYAGKMNFAFGIKNLIDSFTKLKGSDYRLILCGDGDAHNYVENSCKKDKRIIFKGQVSSEMAKQIIENASVLINPRPNDCVYTKYSFPSKNIEYLMSGKPVVAYMLDGMPDMYADFIEVINNNSDLTQILQKACDEKKNQKRYELFYAYAKKNLVAKSIAKKILNL